jgi:predicted DNA-binding transcriptional regulator AlpA
MSSAAPTASRYVDTRGASQHTGFSESYHEKLRVIGGGPPFIKAGKAVRYDVCDLDAWMAELKRRSTSEYAA